MANPEPMVCAGITYIKLAGDFNFGINDKDNDRYRITVFVNNFTDENYSATVVDFRDVYGGGDTVAVYGILPRKSQRYYGVRAKFSF